MDAKWYNAAEEGQINPFKHYAGPLDLLRTPNKNTVLHVYITAVQNETKESIEFVKLVIRKCPSLLAEPNIKGETPLHIAARLGHKNIVEFLIHSIKKAQFKDLERGAEASTSDKMLKKTSADEDTALHEAVRNNHPQVVEILIRENPEFANKANAARESQLYLAAARKNNSIASKILKICLSPAYTSPNGRTALHEAVISGDAAQFLLQGLTARFLKNAGYKRGRPVIRLKSPDSMSIVDNELIRVFEETSKSHQIVATLIATVTFAAGFTVPGGYSGIDGPDEGTAILTRRLAFKTFLLTDTLALALSISVVLIHFLLALQPTNRKIFFLFTWAFIFTVVAMELMMVAFMTGVYAVMPHSSSGLAATICVIGSCFALLYIYLLKFCLCD
ncbi:hypothetical protein GH714_030011 [Hevea brasiliensis]|uniref:PGG domain-containing protein n=1 Tax=Hevea brasiliensis TaxID=3981 RepID=A0A6A6N5I1_HEVBR|nr:hypothetical protein GH714_030011 [Hevea brasiliensis]